MGYKSDDDYRVYTLNSYGNYGNRLQLFALAKVIANYGKKVSVYCPDRIKSFVRMLLRDKNFLKSLNDIIKTIKMVRFTKKYIPGYNNTKKKHRAIIGSDQVWNLAYIKGKQYLLSPTCAEKISSYAASIGRRELSRDEKELFRKALCNYDNISVREESARSLLQPLTSTHISVVLDPTLLLEKDEYRQLECPPKNMSGEERYILCYILGGDEYDSVINDYAKKNNLNVIKFSDKNNSRYGVEEFLYLIHHAELICTDSFHACVFSFIFERPFVAFRRTGKSSYMYTRLRNLIRTFKLKGREFNGKAITNLNTKVDYSEAKMILRKERENSLRYLRGILEINDEK